MLSYTDLMIKSVLEVLEPLDQSNEFAIIGYQGNPSPVLWTYPDGGGLMQATPDNLRLGTGFHPVTGAPIRRLHTHSLRGALRPPVSSRRRHTDE